MHCLRVRRLRVRILPDAPSQVIVLQPLLQGVSTTGKPRIWSLGNLLGIIWTANRVAMWRRFRVAGRLHAARGYLFGRRVMERRIAELIARKNCDVFLRNDFTDLGGYDRVSPTLRRLAEEGHLTKLGYSPYARTVPSPLSGRNVPANPSHVLPFRLWRFELEALPLRFL